MKSNAEPIIEVTSLDFYYGNNQALFDINLTVQPREITALIGILLLAGLGIVFGGGLLAYPDLDGGPTPRQFLSLLNLLIGLKVGAGVTLLALTLFAEDRKWK